VAEELRWEEEMVQELARSMAFPPTPDLRAGVLARLEPVARRPAPPFARFALAGLAALVLAAALTIAISNDARDAVADFLGLAVEGERIEVLPTPAAGFSPTPLPTPLPISTTLETIAQPTTREEVAGGGLDLILPASLGEPRAYYRVFGTPNVVVVDYGAVQIWEFPYQGDYFIGKGIIGGGDVVREVLVDGHKAYWVSGGARIVTVNNSAGTPVAGTQRTVTANALLWAADGLYRRIEGAGTLEEALLLAAEMK